MKLRSHLKKAYRLFHSQAVEKYVLPHVFSQERMMTAQQFSTDQMPRSRNDGGSRIWFHAASAGELESLWPLIVLAGTPKPNLPANEIGVTILSQSAWSALIKLKQRLFDIRAQVRFVGYSPWEGNWGRHLDQFCPDYFVTVKYEAWPDLWVSLQERKIPLVIVGARARKSLRIAKKITELLVGELPQLYLFPCDLEDVERLRHLFPKATLQFVSEPRWERVFERSRIGNPRAEELTRASENSPRPWGVVGNAWLEDLRVLVSHLKRFRRSALFNPPFNGTLWIVPHQLSSENIAKIRAFLDEMDIPFVKTADLSTADLSCALVSARVILVDEMGFLSELYASADWAYVGGGFGAGIHSTIEPAIHGIPISIGPKGSEKFSEVNQLERTGQLSVLRQSSDFLNWVDGLAPRQAQNKSRWKTEAESRCGGASQILYSLFQTESR